MSKAKWRLIIFAISDKSPVLAKLIEKAGSRNVAEVTGVGYSTLRRILNFMYGRSFDVEEVHFLDELIVAAGRFEVKGLKSFCEETAKEKLKRSNAAALFQLAEKHKFESLKQAVRSLLDK